MATDYTSQITAWYQAVQYRNPPASDLAVYNASLQSGALTTAQVQSAIISDSFTSTVVDAVIREYQAAFNRVPDQAGLAYWVGQVSANPATLTNLNTIFANSTEFTTRFGATATTPANGALVTALYTNVYGRAPDAAGLAYWAASGLTAAQLLQAFSNAQEFVTMTTPAIQAFQALEIAGTAPTTGSLFNVPGASTGGGSTFVLTSGVDNLIGTNGSDTFTGDQTAAVATVSAGDLINGGNGTDTFNYFVGGQATPVMPQLNSVEVVNLIGDTAAMTLDTSSIAGITNLNVKNDAKGGDTLTVANGVTVGFDNVVKAGGGLGLETVNFAATATTGGLDVRNGTNLDAGLTVTGAALTSVSVNSTGSAANTIATLTTPNNVTSLSVTGDQKLTVTGALNANILTVAAGSDTGALNLTLGTVAANKTVSVTTGSGADIISLANVTNAGDTVNVNLGAGNDVLKVAGNLDTFAAASSLNGGDGTDVINITTGGDLTATTVKLLNSFEVLDASGGTGNYDVSLGSFSKVEVDLGNSGGLAGAVTFTNAPQSFTLDVLSQKSVNGSVGNSIIETLKTDSTAPAVDSLTVNLISVDGNNNNTAEGKLTVPTLQVNQIENLTINANTATADTGVKASSYLETITTLTDTSLQTLTITGNESLTVTNALLNTTTANLTKIDASGSTGNINLDYSSGVKAVTYLGSAGVDTINASDGGTIYGAGGNDQITLGGATPFTPAVKEVFTATFGATVDADHVTFDGVNVALTAANTGVQNAATFVTAYNAAGTTWSAVDNGNGTVTFTEKTAGAITDVQSSDFVVTSGGAGADITVTAAAPTTQGTNAVNAATSANSDTLVYKAATDAQLTTAGSNVSSGSTVETVTNFKTTGSSDATHAHDFVDLSNIGGFTGYARGALTITGVDPLSGTFAASQTNFFNDGVGNRGVVLDVVGGNTYVFVDVNHDGSFTAGSDLVIKLAGVTNVSATDFNFG